MIPSLPGSSDDIQTHHNPDIQDIHENPIIEFSEPPNDIALDLNSAEKGSQNPPKNQQEENDVPQHKDFQQEVVPVIISPIADEAAILSGVGNGFDSPPPKTRSGNSRQSTAQKSRCHWTHGEIIALFDAKKSQAERAELGLRKMRSSSSGKWDEIADSCKSLGVNKMASQCRDKWERLWPNFKKILDWDKQPPDGKATYWAMTEDEREREGFPRLFDKELFDAMSTRFGFVASLNLPSFVGNPLIEDSGEAATGNTEALPYITNENGQNGTTVVEDTPAVVDNHAPRSSGRKRKTPDRFGVLKPTRDSNKKVDILLEAKEEEDGGNASTKSSKDGQFNKIKSPLDLAECRLLLEERKLKLAERRFSLEERKLEATIEIGKGLIASMERMSSTISSLGIVSSQQQ